MNKDEYKEYQKAYDNGTKGYHAWSSGFCSGCQDCLDDHDICCSHKAEHLIESTGFHSEPSFSWQSCEICGSALGGNRYDAHAIPLVRIGKEYTLDLEKGYHAISSATYETTYFDNEVDCQNYLGKDEIIHFEICVDCLYYMEYGQLDDMTMLDMEE